MRRPDPADGAHRESAFTLVEVMVAALLLLVTMAGFVPFFLSGLEKSSVARYRSAATNIGREMLEEIRQLDYREIVEDKDDPNDPTNLSVRFHPNTREVRGSTFNVDYAVESSNSGGVQLKRVIVTVSWDGTPVGQPAVISSLIHQQFLGPRISSIEFVETTSTDPLKTPFPVLPESITAKVFIATADFDLVYDMPAMIKRDVYLRLFFVDDAGARVPVGESANDYKISKDSVHHSLNADGTLGKVWFEVPLDITVVPVVPDGYWDLQGIAYNEYDQQGNLWRLRVRIENGAPDAPVSLLALGNANNETIHLSWVPGSERDRAFWVLERQKSSDGVTYLGGWTTLTTLLGTASAYHDQGHTPVDAVDTPLDPWGNTDATNYYQYRLWAIDIAGKHGSAGTADEHLPSTDPITTTTTITGTTTTTTSGPASYSVTIRNQTSKAYDITITDSLSAVVFTGRVSKNGGTINATALPAGQYGIRAVEDVNNNPRIIDSTFSLPLHAGQIVMDILS